MNKIENFIESRNNKEIYYSDINNLSIELNFNTLDIVKLLLDTVYTDYAITESKYKRLDQESFRAEVVKHYGKCVITGNCCLRELQACHIIPVKENGSYDLNNGLLLNNAIHQSFDDFMWSINPETLNIETRDDYCGTIIIYGHNNSTVNIDRYNKELMKNIAWHYDKFKNSL